MPDAKLLIPDPQPLESVRMHALLHGRKVEGVLIEHLPDRFVAMLETLVFGALRPFLSVGNQLEQPDVVEHLVRIGRMRPLAEHHDRSEEHTSELQSLMRISYAVFCLTKK